MAHLYYVVRGAFVAEGHAPDGDSIRFVPDRAIDLAPLPGTDRLSPAKDGSVRVRLDGIDAPELHYASCAQRLAKQARDALLSHAGFTSHRVVGDTVLDAPPARGTLLTRTIDPRGRLVAYALAATLEGTRIALPRELLAKTVNAAMLRTGRAYPLLYDTQPPDHRATFAALARAARTQGLGVWRLDRTPAFELVTERSIGEHGALIFPKLFRRCVAYLAERFEGGVKRWLEREAGADNDVVLEGRRLRRLSAYVEDAARGVRTRLDATRVVFVAR